MAAMMCSPDGDMLQADQVTKLLPAGLQHVFRTAEGAGARGFDERTALQRDTAFTEEIAVRHSSVGVVSPTLRYTLTSIAHTAFRCIRVRFGFADEDFRRSVCVPGSIRGGVVGGGRSGQVFFFSRDGKVVFKSASSGEVDTLKALLRDYVRYISNDNLYTLLPRFFGLFRLDVHDGRRPLYLIAMNNVFFINRPIVAKYDLKGSALGRYEAGGGRGAVLKDQNFNSSRLPTVGRQGSPYPPTSNKLHISNNISQPEKDTRQHFLAQLACDCKWLRDHNLVDYSLLVGIADLNSTDMNAGGLGGSTMAPGSMNSHEWGATNGSGVEYSPLGAGAGEVALDSGYAGGGEDAAVTRLPSRGSVYENNRAAPSLTAAHRGSDIKHHAGEETWIHGGITIALESNRADEMYLVGLVDILQEYTCLRACECGWKRAMATLQGADADAMSIVPAADYSDRLRRYIEATTD